MHRTAVIDVVGLTSGLLGPNMPRLSEWAKNGAVAPIRPAFPAVTCTAQTDYLTGRQPQDHGIVGNGWYHAEECEVRFWRQSNRLVHGPKIWDAARAADPKFTCANLFWWFNMYSTADYSVTPRPMYPADGRKLPDVYSAPPELRVNLQKELGTFPLFNFWGPMANIKSTQWIAEAAKKVEERVQATLTLIYLPHLDYNLQRLGSSTPQIAPDLRAVDEVTADLIAFFEGRGVDVLVVSEYGLTDVSRPVHINRALRERGLIAVREEMGLELLDPGASAAFAVADHQVAHVYVNDRSKLSEVRATVEKLAGVKSILDREGQSKCGLNHERAGDFVAVSHADAWFTYYYWLDDARAPDFARTVEIHRKPGYDPVELFLDPKLPLGKGGVAWRLMKRKLGLRTLLDVIPLDATLVKGSHGAVPDNPKDWPVAIARRKALLHDKRLGSTDVYGLMWDHLTRA